MPKDDIQYYINPLTVEAQMFLNTLNQISDDPFPVDVKLLGVLRKIITAITEYFEKSPGEVCTTEITKLVEPESANLLKRIFFCSHCNRGLGKTINHAVKHLVETHHGGETPSDNNNTANTKNNVLKAQTNGVAENNKPSKEKASASKDAANNDQPGDEKAESKGRKRRKAAQEKYEREIMKFPKKLASLVTNINMAAFFNENIPIAEKLKTMPQYAVIEKELLSSLSPAFPNSQIRFYKFGSRITGIGTRNSDLDMFVDIDNCIHTFENSPSEVTLNKLKVATKALRAPKGVWNSIVPIANTRVPIIKIRNVTTSIQLDINFSNGLGFFNSQLVEYLFNLQPLARRVCVYTKKWLSRSKLDDTFPTYSITLMVVFFFQLRQYLPSVDQLQADEGSYVRVGPWIANFQEKSTSDLGIQKLDVSPGQCQKFLHDFFEFYATFNYADHIICPLYGKLIERKRFAEEMPQRYSDYVKEHATEKYCDVDLTNVLIVQDPLQLNHNITKRVTPLHLKAIVAYLEKSVEALK